MARRPSQAADALLCERCGYDLAGLARSGNCPECGTPIAESLPEHRSGTPWQRRIMSPWSWAAAVAAFVAHPWRAWLTARTHTRRWNVLVTINLLIAGAIPAAAAGGVSLRTLGRALPELGYAHALCLLLVVYIVLLAMVEIECVGIRFFGARRGWRISKPVARTIVAHASFGWIASGLGLAVVYLWAGRVSTIRLGGWALAPFPVPLRISGTAMTGLRTSGLDHYWPWIAASFVLGMLVFETWVYLGFRAMRYANPPGAERHLRSTGESSA